MPNLFEVLAALEAVVIDTGDGELVVLIPIDDPGEYPTHLVPVGPDAPFVASSVAWADSAEGLARTSHKAARVVGS